jgi:RNA polymerase sigma factor (sigma-70 family)
MQIADQELLLQLLHEHSAALVLYAQQLCVTPEDVVQEAFVRLLCERVAPSNVVGWLYRVVRNGAISASRAASRRTRHEKLAASARKPWFQPGSDDVLDVETAVAAFESLPSEDREIIVLRIWGNRKFEEIAELVGKSTSTTHRRFEHSLQQLRQACMSGVKRGT